MVAKIQSKLLKKSKNEVSSLGGWAFYITFAQPKLHGSKPQAYEDDIEGREAYIAYI